MASRFDACMAQLAASQIALRGASKTIGHQHRAGRDQDHAEPVHRAKPLAQKDRAKYRHQHDA